MSHNLTIMNILVRVEKRENNYSITVGENLLQRIADSIDFSKYYKIAVVTDSIVARYHLKPLLKHLPAGTSTITLPPGEQCKNIKNVERIWQVLIKNKFDRSSLVINLGGGVICDMGGFAASTYMRGIDFLQVPTTLLAQVDASIGGKVGIDYQGYKNLIGFFRQPVGVIIDVATLKTLPRREFVSGFAEIIKHGLIASKKYFDFATSKKPLEFSQQELIKIISTSCKIKSSIVGSDEHESGLRKLLNFGHTIGHAIEAVSLTSSIPPLNKGGRGGVLLHGEAISIGMLTEARISHARGLLTDRELRIIEAALSHAGLPHQLERVPIKNIMNIMLLDKKNKAGSFQFTLLKHIGSAVYDQEVPQNIINRALSEMISP